MKRNLLAEAIRLALYAPPEIIMAAALLHEIRSEPQP